VRVCGGNPVTRRVTARWGLLPLVLGCAAACGPPRIALPGGTGAPFPEFSQAYAEATASCSGITTLSASMSVSGRAGGAKIPSVRIDAGFAQPDRIRLEGYPRIAFGGKPVFVLVAGGSEATLVLTRDGRVLRGAPPAAIIEALAGVALEPAELRSLAGGCGLGSIQPSTGQTYPNGWAALDAGDTTAFLRQVEGRWRLVAVRRGALIVDYADFGSGRATTVHLRTTAAPGTPAADLTLRLSQVEINPSLDAAVFEPDVPRDAAPLTLEELRRAGPLGGQSGAAHPEPRTSGIRDPGFGIRAEDSLPSLASRPPASESRAPSPEPRTGGFSVRPAS
jgi:hypothetical protein